jgi:hypothetical protein
MALVIRWCAHARRARAPARLRFINDGFHENYLLRDADGAHIRRLVDPAAKNGIAKTKQIIPENGRRERPSPRDTGEAAPHTQPACYPAQVKPLPEAARIAGLLSSDSDAKVGHRSSGESCPGPR